MPARNAVPVGAPCWVDLATSDSERSRDFYTRLFGWTVDDPDPQLGGYANFRKAGVAVAGCMASQPGGVPNAWTVYLSTDDAQKTTEAAGSAGGQVHLPPIAVADLGTMGLLADSGGAAVGLWEPGTFPGFGLVAEPGAPSWFELHTRDYEAALQFYRDVFRWDTQTVSDVPEFRYTVLSHGDEWFAGVFDATSDLTEGVPAHWSVYFGVEDTDAAVEQVVGLGGSVVVPAQDSPYGRIATVTDATGAELRLVAANEAMPAEGEAR